MIAPLVILALVSAGGAGVLSWLVARRIGTRWAIALPVLALAGYVALIVASNDRTYDDLLDLLAVVAAVAGPSLTGALIGIGLSAAQRRKGRARDS